MQTKNCLRCGKLFFQTSSPICPKCVEEEENIFLKVKKYIEENPDNTINMIVEHTEVSAKKILGYIRDGRLTISKGLSGEIRCEKCDRPIESGKLCSSCSNTLAKDFNKIIDKSKTAKSTQNDSSSQTKVFRGSSKK